MSQTYHHINYELCPHFTVGNVNQWGESGYLIYEGSVHTYMEDRHDFAYVVGPPMSFGAFRALISERGIEVPDDFLRALK